MTTEALAGLRMAAERTAGVTSQTLDTALQRMTRRVSEAAIGTGAAKKALDELGLSAAELNALSPDEQFRRVADAMQGVANQGDRVRLSMQLFDTEGVALVNTLAQGSEALDEYTARAAEFGTALSRVDAAKMEQANDAIDDLGASVQGIGNQITIALAPALSAAAKAMTDVTSKTDFWAEVTGKAVQYIIDGLAMVGRAWNGLQALYQGIIGALNQFYGMVTSGLATVLEGLAAVAEFAGFETISSKIAAVQESMALVSDVLKTNSELRYEAMAQEIEQIRGWEETAIAAHQAVAEEANRASKVQVDALKRVSTVRKQTTTSDTKDEKKAANETRRANMEKVSAYENWTNAAMSLGNALFQENKGLAIASIVADTAAGIARTWAQLGWPAALPGVAAIAASGAAQLAAAKGASKGGGGTVSAGGGGGGAGAGTSPVLSDPVLAAGTSQPGRNTNVSIGLEGSFYNREDIRELIRRINDELGDGVTLSGV